MSAYTEFKQFLKDNNVDYNGAGVHTTLLCLSDYIEQYLSDDGIVEIPDIGTLKIEDDKIVFKPDGMRFLRKYE